MGEKIDYIKESRSGSKRSLLEAIIISCITEQKEIFNIPGFDASNLDVQFTINGIDMPVKKVFKGIEKQMNGIVKEEARKMIRYKLNEFQHSLDEIVEHIETVVYNKFDEGEK
jgi:hypothetical protein